MRYYWAIEKLSTNVRACVCARVCVCVLTSSQHHAQAASNGALNCWSLLQARTSHVRPPSFSTLRSSTSIIPRITWLCGSPKQRRTARERSWRLTLSDIITTARWLMERCLTRGGRWIYCRECYSHYWVFPMLNSCLHCRSPVLSYLLMHTWALTRNTQMMKEHQNRYVLQSCKRVVNMEPEPGSSPTIIFEARFRPESQIYRMSQDMRNCGVLVA